MKTYVNSRLLVFLIILVAIFVVKTPFSVANACAPEHDYKACSSGDLYWYDACGIRNDLAESCGSDSCGSWGSNYCKYGDVYHKRTCYDRGCSSGSCYSNSYTDEDLVEECYSSEACIDGKCYVGSEFSFVVTVDESYPNSAIPIKVASNVWLGSSVDFDFTLNDIDISNRVDDGICTVEGDEGWYILNVGDTCETRVPDNIVPGTYVLKAEWDFLGHHEKILDSAFEIKAGYIWSTTESTHGGYIDGSVLYNKGFSQNYVLEDNKYFTCPGNSLNIQLTGTVVTECSNGATSSSIPASIAWVYEGATKIGTKNNNMFNGCCKIHEGITRSEILLTPKGYRPEDSGCSCDLGWTFGGSSSWQAATFNNKGNYAVYLDYIGAMSDAPADFICPKGGAYCTTNWGHKPSEYYNLANLEVLDVSVIDLAAELTENVLNAEWNGSLWKLNANFVGDSIENTFLIEYSVKNVGIGSIELTGGNALCSEEMNCSVITPLPLVVKEGASATILVSTDMPIKIGLKELNFTTEYQNAYGFSCEVGKHISKNIQFEWKDDIPPVINCETEDKKGITSILFNPDVYDPDPSFGFLGIDVCLDGICKQIVCSNTSTICETPISDLELGCIYLNKEYWIRATDIMGNSDIKKCGNIEMKKDLDCICSYDSECNSGLCDGIPQVCMENPKPEMYFI